MTDRQYQLMARSAGAELLRSQGAQILPHTTYGDARTGDPYYAQGTQLSSSYAQNPAQFGGRSDYYLPSDSHDIRAQLLSERRSSFSGGLEDPSQAYSDHNEPRMIAARPGMGQILPYPSPQRPAHLQTSPAAFASADLLRARRAELVAAYSQAPAGGRVGRVGGLDDPVINKEGLLSAGAYLNGPRRTAGLSYEEQDLTIPRVAPGQHDVLGSGAGAVASTRQGGDFERYLLAVQPDKLVRYAAACIPPEPAVKRARYAMMANNVAPPPELDVYSNYRQAKLRRSGVVENNARLDNRADRAGSQLLGTASRSGSGRREKEKEPSRERRRKSDERVRGSEKKSDSPGNVNRNVLNVPNNNGGNRVDQQRNGSQSSEGGNGSIAEKKGRAGPRAPSVQAELPQETAPDEDNPLDSDKDSELGSLGAADLSDFEDEKSQKNNKSKKKVSEEPEAVIDAPLDGMIFGCSSVTFYECMRLQLFGLPSKNKDEVMRVAPGTKLFLFNFDTKELSGIFEAVSHGGMMIQPDAFREFGAFPAQVQVCCAEQCPNVHLADFKPVIKENFVNGFKFNFTLSASQVKDLIRLFRRAARFQHQELQQRQQEGLLHRYIPEPITSEDYLLRNSQHRRQTYIQHPQASFGLSSISSARVVRLSTKSKLRERSSRKARRGRRIKRKVEKGCPEFPKADNCSSLKQPEEKAEADIARNTSKPREDDDISNTNLSVVVRKVIVTDNSKNYYRHKEIVEGTDAIPDNEGSDRLEPDHEIGTSKPGVSEGSDPLEPEREIVPSNPGDSKGRDPPEPDHEIIPSKPGEFPGLQSDHEDCDGKQVSLVEDSSNDGKCGLAGGRSEEPGKGLNVLKGALDNGENVITKSSDCTSPSSGLYEGLSITKTSQLLVNLGSPQKDDVTVGGEVQSVNKVEFSQVVTSDEVLDVEETENENSAVGCSAIFWDKEALESPSKGLHHLLVDDSGEEDGDTVCEKLDDGMRAVETSVGDSRYTITNVSDTDRTDQKREREEGTLEEVDTISICKEGHLEHPVSQREEVWQLANQQERDDGRNCDLTSLEVYSDKGISDVCRSNSLISDAESLSPRVAEGEEMVDIVDDNIHCEITDVEDVAKVMEACASYLLKVDDVERVMEVNDKNVTNDQDVKQIMEMVDEGVVKGEVLQSGNFEAPKEDSKLPKAVESENNVMIEDDDGSSSEFPETSDSEGEGEDGYYLGLAHEVSSDTLDEAEDEHDDEEEDSQVQALGAYSICEWPKVDENVMVRRVEKGSSLPIFEAFEDGDVVDTVNGGVNCAPEIIGHEAKGVSHKGGKVNCAPEILGHEAQGISHEGGKVNCAPEIHGHEPQGVSHEGEKVDDLQQRCVRDERQTNSEETHKTDAVSE